MNIEFIIPKSEWNHRIDDSAQKAGGDTRAKLMKWKQNRHPLKNLWLNFFLRSRQEINDEENIYILEMYFVWS